MKKVLLTLFAAAMGFFATAQTWTPISQHVSGVNYFDNTETISTQAILGSGKAMVIDYSATWCSWCYVMHSNGILEAIQEQLGDQVQCVWVESDPSTPASEITGGGSSQGDWTVTSTGAQVPYPIIDDPAFANLIGGTSVIEGYPTVVLVSPAGYWCSVYGESWGFGPYSASDGVTAIQNLLASMPASGQAPVINDVTIPGIATPNNPVNFSVEVMSVDDYTVAWDFQNGNPATATSANASCSWSTPGTYNVTVTVTNANGTVSRSGSVEVINYAAYYDFEPATGYDDWTLIDADGDGQNWIFNYLRSTGGAAHNGSNGMMASASWTQAAGALTPDNWVFTPAITLPNEDNLTLSWWDKGQDPSWAAEKYAVYVATAPNIESATQLGIYTATPDWRRTVLSLDAYRGQTVYFGFRHYEVTDMFMLDIDDIGVTNDDLSGIDNATAISVKVYPNPVSTEVNVRAENLQEVSILDLSGRVLSTSKAATVDVRNLAAGVYFVRVVTDNGTATTKIVKE